MIKKLNNNKTMALKNQIINYMVIKGNKQTSENLLLKSLKLIQKIYFKNHNKLLKYAIINSSPIINIKQIKRIRKQTKEFPFILKKNIRVSFGIKLILKIIENKSEKTFYEKFNNELIFASKNSGNSIKNKKEIHDHAFIKKKYANYRWF